MTTATPPSHQDNQAVRAACDAVFAALVGHGLTYAEASYVLRWAWDRITNLPINPATE